MSAVRKYNRLDAGFYCGTLGKEHTAEIVARRAEVARQQTRIDQAVERERQANAQHRAMVEAGEVRQWPNVQ